MIVQGSLGFLGTLGPDMLLACRIRDLPSGYEGRSLFIMVMPLLKLAEVFAIKRWK